jgi:hypothetical protein
MLTLRSINKLTWLVTLTAVALAALALVLSAAAQTATPGKPVKSLTVDVAQNMTTFVPDEAPLHEDGMPAYGNRFIIEGFIYPEGTLDDGNGVILLQDDEGNPVVEPEFPDKVIGKWICRGWFVGDGVHTTDEPWAITTQVFAFGDSYGEQTITSEGYELPFSLEAAVYRAITGGTGDYVGASGEQVQSLVGINATQGANFRIEFDLTKK